MGCRSRSDSARDDADDAAAEEHPVPLIRTIRRAGPREQVPRAFAGFPVSLPGFPVYAQSMQSAPVSLEPLEPRRLLSVQYTVTLLDDLLPTNFDSSAPLRINSKGQIAG